MNKLPRHYFDRSPPEPKPKSFIALYGVFCQNPDGTIYGYVEGSFSMSWHTSQVRLWKLQDALYYLNRLNKQSHGGRTKFFIYRLTRKSPRARIVADFTGFLEHPYSKTFRNARFKLNNGEVR